MNSYLVLGDKEALVVDGQFFKADATKVVDLIKASGKTLTAVFLTHAHPDHYLGLEVIADAFPKAKIVATKAVVDDFNMTAPGTFMYLKGMYGDALADGLAAPEALAGSSILLDGRSLDVIEMPNPGESSVAAAIGLDAPSALLAGDLVYNDIHLVLSSCAWKGWLDNLTAIKAKGFQDIYPGHGAKASMAVFDADAQYINDVVPILEAAATTDEAKMKIKAKYLAYLSDLLLGFSTDGYFMSCKGK